MRDVDLNYEAECILYHAMNNCVREKKNQRPGAADQTIHGARCGPAHIHAIQELKPQSRTH